VKGKTVEWYTCTAQAELERRQAAQKATYALQRERMQNDPEYREQQLQSRKTAREQKRKALEEDPLHIDVRKDADRMAKVRRVAREIQDALNAQE
jgi:hypothetical protein